MPLGYRQACIRDSILVGMNNLGVRKMREDNRSSTQQSKKGRKWILIFIGVLILAVLIGWAWQSYKFGRSMRHFAEGCAQSLANGIAMFGSERIANKDWSELQSYADTTVRNHVVAYIAIVDSRGAAVVHTDRSLLDQEIIRPRERGVVSASAPVALDSNQAATVWVGIRIPNQ